MNTKLLLCVLLLLPFCQPTVAQPLTESEIQKIDAYIQERVDEQDPGVAYGVVRNGVIELEKYHGMANLQHMIPVAAETRFNIASVAKQFTALMVLELVMQDKIQLDDDLRDYIEGMYPDFKEPILIRHLLTHSSGIRDSYELLNVQHKPWWRQVGLDNGDVVELISSQQSFNFTPGTAYSYSNSNYTLLCQIIEVASGTPFHEYARAFFDRLDMEDTVFNKNYMHVIPYVALPYSDWGNGVWRQYPQVTSLYGDGFLFTTLNDQLAFEIAIQNAKKKGNKLLAHSQKAVKGAEITSYGFGLELSNRNGRPAVHHSGATGSFHAQVVRYPEINVSIVVMSNNNRIWSGYVADTISSILLPDTPSESDDAMFAKTSYAKPLPADALTGEYVNDDGFVIRIRPQSDTLQWKEKNWNPRFLAPESGSIYHFTYNPAIKVAFQDEQFIVYEPGAAPSIHTKLPAFSPDRAYKQQLVGNYYNEELGVTFTLSLGEGDELSLYSDAKDRSYPVEIVQQDYLQASDYSIKVQRDGVESLRLSFGRLRGVEFSRVGGIGLE